MEKQKSGSGTLMGMFLGLCAFWNGAAVIGGLLILCGFAIFSDGKVDYAVMAGVSIFFSCLQSKIFIVGSAMSLRFIWDFWQRIRLSREL